MKYVRPYLTMIISLCAVLLVLGFLVYERVSPGGMFADLQNELREISPQIAEAQYTDLDGNSVTLRQFKGKPLIINAWASWTPFSQTELPVYNRLMAMYGDKIQILAINRMEQVHVIRSFLSTYSIDQTITFLVDPTDYFYRTIGGYSMPETIFYNADGTIFLHKRGVSTEAEAIEIIDALLSHNR